MSGLIDSTQGLSFGDGLIWTAAIGGATLIIEADNPTPGVELTWGEDDFLVWGVDYLVWGDE